MHDVRTYLNNNYRDADRLMLYVLWGLFVLGLALSGLHDTLSWALVAGLPIVLIPTALIITAGGRRITRCVVGAAFMAFTALHIHQAGGMIETHFGVFVLMSFLLFYRDWLVIVVAAVVIALHHLTFNYLQEWGYGVRCLTETGLGIVAVHAAYVLAESAVLSYLAILLRREALQSAELKVSVAALTGSGRGIIDLRVHNADARSESGIALQGVVNMLHEAVIRVQRGSAAMATASSEIASGNQDLAARTEQQVAALGVTASSMKDMTATVKANASNAREANQMALDASAIAVKGGQLVAQVVETMESINGSSKKIADITGVIDGIAFQTNILALNASVEAARDIKALIADSVTKVDAGSEQVAHAGATMGDIVDSIQRVNAIVQGIVAASEAQSADIEQVNAAIDRIDQVTKQNAAVVEHAADSAASLQEQAATLVDVIDVFRLEDSAVAAQPAAPRQLSR